MSYIFTARTDPAFSAAIGSLQQGNTYKIRVTVSSGIYYSNAEIIRTVNYVPYNGTCETSSTEGNSDKILQTLKLRLPLKPIKTAMKRWYLYLSGR